MRTLRGWVLGALVGLALAAFAAQALPAAATELPTDPKCEFIASPGSSKCMLPFPDDYYTKVDPTSPTGRPSPRTTASRWPFWARARMIRFLFRRSSSNAAESRTL